MGVTGLWEIIEGAAQSRSLAHLAIVEGFEGNRSGRRAYRLGIDASLWYQHATCIRDDGTKGANPHLRTLFFRLCKLTSYPLLPLFVFDGRERPKVKRGSKMGKSGSHNMTAKFKEMIDCFGWEWRMARGEAEAELAYLNSIGVIDAVVTDDVDALVFGATTLMRNPSLGLTGNRNNPATNSAGKASDKHYKVFTMENIRRHASIRLDRNGMILIALLAGGDYDKGVKRLGPIAAYALARLGFGERLVEAYRRGAAHLQATLPHWRDQLNQELHTNNSTLLPHRFPSITLDTSFPNIALLEDYLNPICSAYSNLGAASLALRDRGDISLPRIAKFAEDHFDEWGHRSRLVYRFYDLLYEGAIVHVLRRAALEADEKERQTPGRPTVGTPASLVKKYLDPVKRNQQEDRLASAFARRDNYSSSQRASTSAVAAADAPDPHPLIIEIERVRLSPDTDHIPEYRVLIDCNLLDSLTNKGIAGKHAELALTSAQAKAASSDNPVTRREQLRIWVAQSIMQRVHPDVVENYQRKQAEKGNKKTTAGKGKGKRTAREDDSEEDEEEMDNIDDLDLRSPAKSSRRRTRKNVAASVPAGPSIKSALDERPITPISASQAREPTRPIIYHNVGIIKSEDPGNPYTFRFTYTNPDDPDMLILDEDEISNEVSTLPALPASLIPSSATSASAVLPQPPATPRRRNARATSSSQPPAPRRWKATQPRTSQATANDALALVEGLEAGPDEPMPMMFAAHEEDIIDRALGLLPTTPKKRGRSKASTSAQPAKRKRTQGPATLGSSLPEMDDGNVRPQARKRKNAPNAVKPSLSSRALSGKPRRQPAAFPEIPPFGNPGDIPPHKQTRDDVVDISSSEDEFQDLSQYGYQKRKNARSSLLQFPSSSQDSDLYDGIDADAPSTLGRPKVAKPYGWRAGSEMPSSSMSDAFLDDVQFTFDLT